MFVLSVLGHVDHGKSALLKAITGMDPDKRPIEKKRGMTVDLGFVHLDVGGETVGIVDVPGHKTYLKNLIAGLMQVDAFLFVVAADDGWMPQSEEHLRLIKTLGKNKGLIVISKSDLVSSQRIESLKKECKDRFQSFLRGDFECSSVSVKETVSVKAFTEKISQLARSYTRQAKSSACRLWVDKRFTPQGQSVVVTGTLAAGTLNIHDALYLWPAKKEVKVKRIECYGKEVKSVTATTRVALQLGQCKAETVSRGSCLSATPFPLTKTLDAEIEYWESIPKRSVRGKLSLGTLELEATLIALGGSVRQFARIKLKTEIPAAVGDRFLFRTSGGEKVIGGGTVLDSTSSVKRHKEALRKLEAGATDPLPQIEKKEQALNTPIGFTPREREILSFIRNKAVPVPFDALGLSKSEKGVPYELSRKKDLIKLGENHFLDKSIYVSYMNKVFKLLSVRRFAKTSELKEILGHASRKHAVLILEKMDEDRVTYLKEGVRRLLKDSL